jgi:hypothetical protein
MALPAGWKSQQVDTGIPNLKATFRKEGTSAEMDVYCKSAFDSQNTLAIFLLKLVDSQTISDKELWPEYSMGGGNFDPEFQAFTTKVSGPGGTVIDKNFYMSWKIPSGFSCKYAILLSVEKSEAKEIEGDFLAIVRSLK